ncbi:hypothetical protein FSP39_021437 [Pinctada imbricata]|uniref:NADH dehydrogenase [ubiquinone] 1 alpha subcomplex subunit 8 n=1 Tax=Pinctada imbricata TaxID=66713 RepID=A0AA89CA77_PINIB|nr:hypothetical protein FSP39_021437 [Pinctada imbricata]
MTNEEYMPSYEELTVPELKLTSPELRAGALYFGKFCDDTCKEFMLCRSETGDRRKCVNEGKEVTRCGFQFFGKVKKHCLPEFTQYYKCIDRVWFNELGYAQCRDLQHPFDECVKEKIGVERPYVGYFSKRRLYTNDRPEPPPEEIMIKRSTTMPPTKEELNERKLQSIVRPRGHLFSQSFGTRVFREESGEPIPHEKEES